MRKISFSKMILILLVIILLGYLLFVVSEISGQVVKAVENVFGFD